MSDPIEKAENFVVLLFMVAALFFLFKLFGTQKKDAPEKPASSVPNSTPLSADSVWTNVGLGIAAVPKGILGGIAKTFVDFFGLPTAGDGTAASTQTATSGQNDEPINGTDLSDYLQGHPDSQQLWYTQPGGNA